MDEIEQRLRTATDSCISSYDAWRKNQKDTGVREALLEAVHELRKVAARLEIEIAVSERDEMAAKPIPIPPHRSSRKPGGGDNQFDDNIGNAVESGGGNVGPNFQQRGPQHGGGHQNAMRRRRMGPGGPGGGHGGGNGPQGGRDDQG